MEDPFDFELEMDIALMGIPNGHNYVDFELPGYANEIFADSEHPLDPRRTSYGAYFISM
jgi:hypothetical protein